MDLSADLEPMKANLNENHSGIYGGLYPLDAGTKHPLEEPYELETLMYGSEGKPPMAT